MNWNRFLGLAVIVSVVVNLLLAGFIIGRIIPDHMPMSGYAFDRTAPIQNGPGGRERTAAMERGELNIELGARALSRSSRQVVRRVMQEHAESMRETIRMVRAKRREVLTLLVESPEDIGRIETVFNELADITAAAQKGSQYVVLEIAKQLPEDERAAFLRALSSSSRRRVPHR